jgi:hypothetical protein
MSIRALSSDPDKVIPISKAKAGQNPMQGVHESDLDKWAKIAQNTLPQTQFFQKETTTKEKED